MIPYDKIRLRSF